MATKRTAKRTVKKTAKQTAKQAVKRNARPAAGQAAKRASKPAKRTVRASAARASKPAARPGRGGGAIVRVNDKTIEQAIVTSRLPVLVEFSAGWCGPCKALAKVLPAIAQKYDGRIRVVEVDIDESPKAAADFSIEGVPTLILFDRGNLLGLDVGFCSRRSTEAWLGKALALGQRKAKRNPGCTCCG
jgi:thioredoxin 1